MKHERRWLDGARWRPTDDRVFLRAWGLLIASMALGSIAAGLVWTVIFSLFLPLTLSTGALLFGVLLALPAGILAGIAGLVYLQFLPGILQPAPPYVRRGWWLFVVGPGLLPLSFLGVEIYSKAYAYPGLDPGLYGAAYEAIVIPGTMIFVVLGRRFGVFAGWPPLISRKDQKPLANPACKP